MADKSKQRDRSNAGASEDGNKDLDLQIDALLNPDQPSAEKPRAGRTGRRSSRNKRDRKARDDAEFKMLAEVMDSTSGTIVRVSDDGLEVIIEALYPGVSYEQVMEALREHDVQFGVDETAVRKAVNRADRSGQVQRNEVVARGVPPVVEAEGRIDYDVPVYGSDTDGENASGFEILKSLLEEGEMHELEELDLPVKAVRPGDPLLTLVGPRGMPGRDVFGRAIPLDSLEAAPPTPGEHVQVSEDGQTCYSSNIYGYAGLIDGMVWVLPPIWISPDNLEIYFLNLPQVGQRCTPQPEHIRELLSLYFVEYGIDEQCIALACKRGQEENPTRLTPVARGDAGCPGKDAEVKMTFDTAGISPLSQVWDLLGSSCFEDLEQGQGIPVQAVLPGQVVTRRLPPTEGTFGRDVFGEEIPAEPGRDQDLVAGDHVEVSEDGQTCVSKIYGYAGLIDEAVCVLPPIWISPDNLEVYFLNLPQVGEVHRPRPEDVRQALELAGVVYGIDEIRIGALCEGKADALCVRIAEAKRLVPGLDAELTFAFDVEKKPGKILEDGSIDFKQLNLTPIVKPDQFVAEKKPTTKGVAGKDVKGQTVKAANGEDFRVFTKQNVRVEKDGGNLRFYSKIEGGLSVMRSWKGSSDKPEFTLAVNRIHQIQSDVDYSTGNIDFPGEVCVRGSVRSGFSVRAEGGISVGGGVEDKVSLFAEGDVVVTHGIMGKETEVSAGGCVRAKFIQDASISAGGDVDVGSHLFNGSVRSDGVVSIYGKGTTQTSSHLVGVFVWARTRIWAQSIGSDYVSNTKLVAGVDRELFKRLTQAKKGLELCETCITRLLRSLGLTAPDAAQIERVLRTARSGKQRDFVVASVKKLGDLSEVDQKYKSEVEEVKAQMQQVAEEASIQVANRVVPGVDMRIGNEQIRVEEEARCVRFDLVEEDGAFSIKQTPL